MEKYSSKIFSSLFIFGLCGTVGVLVDLDHPLSILIWRYWDNKATEGRIWHAPVFTLTGAALLYMGSLSGRLYLKLILAGVALMTLLILIFSPYVVWGLER